MMHNNNNKQKMYKAQKNKTTTKFKVLKLKKI